MADETLEKWAAAQTSGTGGRGCSICALGEAAVADVARVVELNRLGEAAVTLRGMREWLISKYGFNRKSGVIRVHVVQCLGENGWSRG